MRLTAGNFLSSIVLPSFEHTFPITVEGRAQHWLCNTLMISEMGNMLQLWKQTAVKGADYITCPIDYPEKLFLLNYSMNTISTYHSLLTAFSQQL